MPDPTPDFAPTDLTRVKRLPERGRYDRATVHAILDAGFVCHLGYVVNDQPVVIPTSYWRDGDYVYVHGSAASRTLRSLGGAGLPCCLTVTHTDGMVLARSAFHHSINYRSVMVFGTAQPVNDEADKRRALEAFVERLYPGRWAMLRPMTGQELKATTVLRIALEEVSAKIRTGPPKDDEEDYDLPIWAGVVPLVTEPGPIEPDPRLQPGLDAPEHVQRFGRR